MALSTAANQAAEERISVASNWTLVWWRFRKHRLAMISGVILLILMRSCCVRISSDQDPELTEARQAFIPVQGIHLSMAHGSTPGSRRSSAGAIPRHCAWNGAPILRRGSHRLSRAGQGIQAFRADPANRHLVGALDQSQRIFLLGSDRLGRDQWSRIMHGTQTSMTIGSVAVTLSVILGIVLGGTPGYLGGWAPSCSSSGLIEPAVNWCR